MFNVYDLKCEYRMRPVGICESRPRFSWKINSDEKKIKSIQPKSVNLIWERHYIVDFGQVINGPILRVIYPIRILWWNMW